MAILEILAAAAALTEPGLSKLITLDDYPSEALRGSESTVAYVELRIEADGRVTRCDVIDAKGSKPLAQKVCRIALRKKVAPARLANGAAAPAQLREIFRLMVPGTPAAAEVSGVVRPADAEFTVNRLPGGARSADTRVTLAINPEGRAAACQAGGSGSDAALAILACNQLSEGDFAKLADAGGRPTAYVTTRKVRFALP